MFSIFKRKSSVISPRTLTTVAMLSAVSYILAFLEFPVPLSPSFAKMDLSDLPALVGTFICGPAAGLLIEFVKNALRLLSTSTGGVGELANFVIGGSYVFAAGFLLYRKCHSRWAAWISCLAASVLMGIVAAIMNYFVLLPMFEQFLPLDQLIVSFSAWIPWIKTKFDVVLYNALPFNFIKGLVVSAVTIAVYQKIAPALKGINMKGIGGSSHEDKGLSPISRR